MTQLHSLRTANHRPYADVYADSTERLAATGFVRAFGGGVVPFATEDLYKKVLQLDNATEWVLTAITPTWVQVSGAGSLANDSITNALIANMAQSTIKGRASGAGTGDPTDLSASQATAILNAVVGDSGSGGTKGLVPAPGAGDAAAGKFLKADGTFAVPSGTGAETGANSDITSMDGLTGALENPTKIIFPEAAAPSTPGANKVVLYAKSDGLLYSKDDAGTETVVTGGGGGSIAPLELTDANTISQVNGTSAQTTYVYKSKVSGTEYQRLKIDCSHASGIRLVADYLNATGINILLGNTGSANSVLVGSGDMYPTTSRTYNCGTSANLWNQFNGYQFISNNASDTSGGGFSFSGGPDLYRTASGTMEIKDPTGAFNKIHLGLGQANVNVAFVKPASVQYIEVRLGDESAYAPILASRFGFGSTTVFDSSGSGSPEGVLTAAVGSTYRRTDGGAGTTFYVKESGSGNTGWVAK